MIRWAETGMAVTCRSSAATTRRLRNTSGPGNSILSRWSRNANLTRALYWARRYDEAIAQARRTLELDPASAWPSSGWKARSGTRGCSRKRWRCASRSPTPEQAQIIARTFQRDGFQALLRKSGETFRKSGLLVTAARCYAQSGDREEAIALLETCSQRRCSDLVSLNVEPDFDALRTDPRFQKLVRQIGLRSLVGQRPGFTRPDSRESTFHVRGIPRELIRADAAPISGLRAFEPYRGNGSNRLPGAAGQGAP